VGDYTRLSDDELLARTKDEPEAFGELYERHVRSVLGFLRHEGLATQDALDVTAEVFAAAFIDDPRAYVQPTLELTYEDGSTRVLRGP